MMVYVESHVEQSVKKIKIKTDDNFIICGRFENNLTCINNMEPIIIFKPGMSHEPFLLVKENSDSFLKSVRQ